jgi:hypothetical protein
MLLNVRSSCPEGHKNKYITLATSWFSKRNTTTFSLFVFIFIMQAQQIYVIQKVFQYKYLTWNGHNLKTTLRRINQCTPLHGHAISSQVAPIHATGKLVALSISRIFIAGDTMHLRIFDKYKPQVKVAYIRILMLTAHKQELKSRWRE